jgi:hypothetical protein
MAKTPSKKFYPLRKGFNDALGYYTARDVKALPSKTERIYDNDIVYTGNRSMGFITNAHNLFE